jgi:hypothetical protein
MKTAFYTISGLAIVLLVALVWFWARSIDEDRIHELESEMVNLRASRDSIKTVVAYKDSLQAIVQDRTNDLQAEAEDLRAEVDRLEEERREQEFDVRRLDSFAAEEAEFLETFPALRNTARLMTVRRDEFDLQFIGIPLAATETFVIDHEDAQNYRAQRDTLLQLDELNQEVVALKDSLFLLEQEKTQAYAAGYADAFGKYEALNAEYISTLQNPCVDVFPNQSTAIIAGGVGLVAGVALGAVVTSATQ